MAGDFGKPTAGLLTDITGFNRIEPIQGSPDNSTWCLPVALSGSSGVQPTEDSADGTPGSTAPPVAIQIAGSDGGGLLRVVSTDSSGKLNVNATVTGSTSNPAAGPTGSAVPSSADYLGAKDGSGNLVGLLAESVTNPNLRVAIFNGTNEVSVVSNKLLVTAGIDQTTPGTTNGVQINAGTALIGKVGIDQTTPGTTNKVSIGTDGTVAINAALPAGANVIGKVSIDQTTPGTTNLVALSAETTKVIGVTRNADGSGNLLTTNSSTFTAKNALDGNLLGTLGTAFSTAGKVDVKGADGDVFVRQATAANLNATVVQATAANLNVTAQPGNTQNTTPWLVQSVPGTTGGTTVFHLASAATTNATSIKASAGQLYGWMITNTNTTANATRWVAFHNTAGTPTAGASIYFKIGIPAGGAANVSYDEGIAFSTGIAITTVTGAADSDATAVAVNDLIINLFYK